MKCYRNQNAQPCAPSPALSPPLTVRAAIFGNILGTFLTGRKTVSLERPDDKWKLVA